MGSRTKQKNVRNFLYSSFIILCVLCISIGYSSFHSAMEISDMKMAVRMNCLGAEP